MTLSRQGRHRALYGFCHQNGQAAPIVGKIARLATALSVSPAWLGFGIGDMLTESAMATFDDMGARLQTTRVDRAVNKAQLGGLAGLTAPSITQIEKGGQTGVEVVAALDLALGVSPSWLAFSIEPKILLSRRRARPPAQTPALED